jgi:hypothetical protein
MLVWLVAALWVGPALAAQPSSVTLVAWVGANTDLRVSQVAIVGPDNVYSVEPLGPRLPTGEVLALVRTEALNADWRTAHQFQSWDAHLLFDCQGGRVRVLRSTSYAEHNRGGTAKPDERGDAWFSPDKGDPATRLLAAACDASFDWPLRGAAATSPNTEPPATPVSAPALQSAATERSTPAAPPALSTPVAPATHVARADSAQAAPLAPRPARIAVAPVALAQAVQPLVAERPATLQKASFVALPTAPQTLAAPPRVVVERPRVIAAADAASRTCRRVAGAVRTWVWRRVEVAWTRHGEPPSPVVTPPAVGVTT